MLKSIVSLLHRATGAGSSVPQLVAAAGLPPPVSAALLAPLTADEHSAVQAVEAMRERTEHDRRQISVMDHGAGSGSEHRTAEEMERGVLKTKIVGDLCKGLSKPPAWGELLFKLVRHQRSQSCIEMGTCLGVSASYIASALKLNGRGRLVTLEGADAVAEIAAANLRSLQLDNTEVRLGTFSKTLLPALEALRPVDFMFIDGHHDRDATLHYLAVARPFLAPVNIVVFDDIDWSDGMREAWANISRSRQAYSLGNVGICLDVV